MSDVQDCIHRIKVCVAETVQSTTADEHRQILSALVDDINTLLQVVDEAEALRHQMRFAW
jgi:hypothetical protein